MIGFTRSATVVFAVALLSAGAEVQARSAHSRHAASKPLLKATPPGTPPPPPRPLQPPLKLSEDPPITVTPGSARPGDLLFIEVEGAHELPTGTLGKRPIAFYAFGKHHEALVPLPLETQPGPLAIEIKTVSVKGPRTSLGNVTVEEPHFPAKELTVAGKFIEPPADVKKRIAEDKEAYAKAFAQPLEPRLFTSAFEWPRPPVFNAHFGDQRVFNGHQDSQHYGSDLAGKTGDPVMAANDGVVVMARECYSSGNTVLLHHGGNAYTAYFHFSEIGVKFGQRVKRGELLGKVGKTGRVTGPHLHFGMKVDGLYVDPESMLKLSFPPRSP